MTENKERSLESGKTFLPDWAVFDGRVVSVIAAAGAALAFYIYVLE